MTAFTTSGTGEDLKATIHALTCFISGLMGIYNLVAFNDRHEPHLLAHGLFYSSMSVYEAMRVRHHLLEWKG